MDDREISELEEYSLYSKFLEVATEMLFVSDGDQEQYDISDESDPEYDFEELDDLLNDEEAMDSEEIDDIDTDIMQCIINMIELEYVLQNDCPKKRRKVERRWGVHPLNQMRREKGHFHNLFEEMLAHDHDKFCNYTRMSPERFQHLFELIEKKITKESPNAIPPKCRLLITLRYFKYIRSTVN